MQSTINIDLAFGVPGEVIFNGPQRAESVIINSAGQANVIGFGCTKNNGTNVASVGGTGVFGGILLSPKTGASLGTASGTLAPTMTIPDNQQVELMTMGHVVVALTGAANIGDQVQFNNTTGALSAVAPGAAATGGNTLINGAAVFRYPTAAAGLVVISLNA